MSSNDNVIIPGPSFQINLPRLDACHPVRYSRRLLFFRCTSSAEHDAQLAAFKTGLQRLVFRCPILGGSIGPLPAEEASDENPDWRTIAPDRGLELIIRDLRTKIPSFEKFEAAGFPPLDLPYELLAPVPQDIGNVGPACKVQFSAIDGGTIVTFSMSHCVADGAGANELMRILSEETRLAQEHATADATNEDPSIPVATGIGIDRSVLREITSELPFDIQDHPGYTSGSSDPSSPEKSVLGFTATGSEIPVLLHISPSALGRLKEEAQLPDAPSISTHDALSALMWRSVLLIRSLRSTIPQDLSSLTGSVFMPSNARRHLGLPPSYVGNAVYQLAASLDLATLFSPSGLGHAASAVRRAINAVRPALVASLIAKSKDMWIDWAFPGTMLTTGVAMGTDWRNDELYGHDWGTAFGPLMRYRYPNGAFNCIMPKLPDGAAEVMVGILPEEVEVLKGPECFGKYI
ncbi:hypothetical protein P152DRAFT_476052 [Eremomyces bilateralis CBS 781.70]|uniref:Trichothecene 3-O-acetyltransferase-like N-terminal domain-containing protein n=1 Tax=Eremomyces bilateralis CBS 781.70 TaxID=1392243 RepID=A0A6G1FWB8_9PEZI|nr:uncharacterized protein P152DRAFT_476052 [Eremomyces bilateralis CBS 781.70]KAF1809919.1 hypothetical protein P152DRAFT_476052 [Eremomyces bilateralis CBS 781.70]